MAVKAFLNYNIELMKKILIITNLFLSIYGFAQVKVAIPNSNSTETGAISNNSCAASFKVCQNINQTFSFEPLSTGNCNNNSLFYSLNFAGPSVNGLLINVSGANGSWELFGPFNEFSLGICDQINSYSINSSTGTFNGTSFNITNSIGGLYILKLTTSTCQGTVSIINSGDVRFNCSDDFLCTECVTSFSPTPGKYIVSAWVKEKDAPNSVTTYTNSSIQISFQGSTQTILPMYPSGQIIDGWQRIENGFEIPNDATGINIELIANGSTVYFDDIRFFPIDGSMMSYVYDPISLRLMAELDERNYATLYEYDEEGKLVRVKKETEKGIMTIQENRDNIKKN
jgi:hypothetical protein